ncbi:uncharacterized protein DDB_G0271670-like isoform X2 [Xiphias gladius]|uniref:uncharacterized protein DDB_G0271670-like isoform X2 n=1 Tax=Xiphias gladius TaxID=8245 RepID=UPI001A99486F|nr:uncharacterized protein DDB_G0271670-like isoform X2 [Xiphias gladius]
MNSQLHAKVRSPKKRTNSSSLSRDGKLLEEHPLKLRVKALMKQRCCDPCVQPTNTEVPDVTPPPSQSVASPTKGENSDNKGFQRFLSVLNKGVDIDLLSRIVNDDSEDLALGEELLNIQPPAVENKPEPGESQRSNSGASLLDPSRASSGESETEALITERSHNERLSLPDEEKKTDGGDDSFGSSSRSKSPPAVKKKKQKEEEKPKVDEQREQLQNILKTLGLSLEVEEMSKLADRTQERLYGKKHEGRWGAESRGEHESHRKGTHRHYRNSSSSSSSSSAYSSSSSSSTSRSTSRSFSTSPSRLCSSHSRDSKRRRASERSCSGSRSRDGLTLHDGNQDSKEAQRPRDVDKDRKDSKQISTYHHPYPQEQTYSYSHPAAISAFPDYSLSQYSQYTAYCTGTYSAATNSYSAFTQGAIPPPLDSSQYPYPQNSDLYFPGSVVAPNMVYPHHDPFEDINLLVNPDLSKSEGQIGSAGCRYLRVISTKQSTTRSCLKELTKGHKRKGKYIRKCRVWFQKLKERNRQQKLAAKRAKQSKDSAGKVEASRGDEDDSETGQSKEEKIQPTEEEIKVNLRKKLEAFNQKVKKQVTQTANPLTSQTG